MINTPTLPAAPVETLSQLLAVVSDPAKHKTLLDALVQARNEATAERAKLSTLQTERDTFEREKSAWGAKAELAERDHRNKLADLDVKLEQLRKDRVSHQADIEALATDRAALAASQRQHADQLAQVQKLKATLA